MHETARPSERYGTGSTGTPPMGDRWSGNGRGLSLAWRRATNRIGLILLGVALVSVPADAQTAGIWISPAELAARPTSGAGWTSLLNAANKTCTTPDLSNQDDNANVCVLANALVYARTGDLKSRLDVVDAIWKIVGAGAYNGRALALGRELGAYVISADLINLRNYDASLDDVFRETIRRLLTTPTIDGPKNLIACHEGRPNNWGTWCGGSRAAVAAYLGDAAELARVAKVFKGWLGDRASYAGFTYGDLAWQFNPTQPVGINPKGSTKQGYSIDGVLPDDQRRGGSFTWPPPKEDYVYGALEGALMQAVILSRAGYDTFNWQDRALLRAYEWLNGQAQYPAVGNDTWQPHLVNFYYQTRFAAPMPATPGKAMGWTDWTHYPPPTSSPTNTKPTVSIATPLNNSSVTQGALISFSGSATDTQDGTLTSKLAWTSSLDGAIGTGGAFSKALSVGTHVVTAAVTDNGGLTASAQITVTVTATSTPPPTTTPLLAVRGYKVNGFAYADLTWAGLKSSTVDVRRNITKIAPAVANTGSRTDAIGTTTGTYTYKVCEAGTSVCTPRVSVTVTSSGISVGQPY